jgi:hypothetical protein
MNHPLAQLVALTCHANAFLQGRMVPRFFPSNSTCTFCDSITFVRVSRTLLGTRRETQVASDPDSWFVHLVTAKVSAIRLSRTPQHNPKISDRMAGAFAGAGGWSMEAVQPNGTGAMWLSRWDVWNQHAPDRRIWRVRYGRVPQRRPPDAPVTDLNSLAGRLRAVLADIHAFSEKEKCGGFTDRFFQAMETLDSGGERRHGYHEDLAPEGCLPSIARCLLDACQSAWVFGGMGSWNDLMFHGDVQAEYQRASDQLFLILGEVLQAAANASCADR